MRSGWPSVIAAVLVSTASGGARSQPADVSFPLFTAFDPVEQAVYGDAIRGMMAGSRNAFRNEELFSGTFREAMDAGDLWTAAVLFLEHQTAVAVKINFELVRGGVPFGFEQIEGMPPFDPTQHGGVPWGAWQEIAYIGRAQARGSLTVANASLARAIESIEVDLLPHMDR